MRLLASDYAFKSVYASRDEPTVRSALQNYQNRLSDVSLIALCDLDGQVLSNTHRSQWSGQPFPLIDILDRADDSENGETIALGILDGVLYRLIVTPLLAPDIEAWIIGGFRLDDARAEKFSELTGSEISLFLDIESDPRLVASSLDKRRRQELLERLQEAGDSGLAGEIKIGGETYISQALELNQDQLPRVSALVQQSLDAALAPYRSLSKFVTWIFFASIAIALLSIVVLANRVTRSLRDLTRGARSIAEGNLETLVEAHGRDEFAQLALSFNEMARDLADKERVRDLLGKVVSPEIAGKLMQEGVELGGEERQVTVLFCDLQGFTRLAEKRSPTQVLNTLNSFFSGVSGIIEAHGGVVDKYIGDAVMALFGAPMDDHRHACRAVACGIEICTQAENLLANFGDHGEAPCGFGVGIHSGIAVAGNIGSSSRLNYTVIGDTVNVASRVESQTRVFGVPLLITEATAALCPDQALDRLGSARLKGRKGEIDLYTSNQTKPPGNAPLAGFDIPLTH